MGQPTLRLTPFRLRLKQPLETARGTETVREGITALLDDGAGAIGLGEAAPLPSFGTESMSECLAVLSNATALMSEVRLPETLLEVARTINALGVDRRTPAARHALEVALLDLVAHRSGITVASLLSSSSRRFVTVNALLTAQRTEDLVKEGRSALSQGFQTLKVKVGTGPVAHDLDRIAILRAAVGPAAKIRLDANGAWSESDARLALESLAPVELCEQPVAPGDVDLLASLRGTVPCLIAADEAIGDEARHHAILERDPPACDILVLKPMVLGGLLPAFALANRAALVGVDSYVTSSLDGVIARAAASHLAAALPRATYASGLAVGSLFIDEPPGHPYQPARGRITLPTAGGLGLAGWHASFGRGNV